MPDAPNQHFKNADPKAARKIVAERISAMNDAVDLEAPDPSGRPVLFFSATTQIRRPTFATVGMALVAWALRMAGRPVTFLSCRRGMSQCVLGANRESVFTQPPCDSCIAYRSRIDPGRATSSLVLSTDLFEAFSRVVPDQWEDLIAFERGGLQYGRLCLPSLRWIERVGTLSGTPFQRAMLREFIVSALALATDVTAQLERSRPETVVFWNGVHFPEAVVRQIALRLGVRSVTMETGFQTPSLYLSEGYSAQYDIEVPREFHMSRADEIDLDNLLAARRSGEIIMANRPIATRQNRIEPTLEARLAGYRHVVPVFTNVAWDTSQAFADCLFPSMFAWLDATLQAARSYPETAFLLRAHPDEARTDKPSREPVGTWLAASGYDKLPNVIFIRPESPTSSYELVDRAKFCIAYNSTIGIEASIRGAYVLAGGWARYRRAGVGRHVGSREEYLRVLNELLSLPRKAKPPSKWSSAARRLMYFCHRYASLDVGRFISLLEYPEFGIKDFHPHDLAPGQSNIIDTIVRGVLVGGHVALPFPRRRLISTLIKLVETLGDQSSCVANRCPAPRA